MEISGDQIIAAIAVGIAGIVAISGGAAYVASLLVKNQVSEEVGKVRIEMQQDRVRAVAEQAEHQVTRHQVNELVKLFDDHEKRLRALEDQ